MQQEGRCPRAAKDAVLRGKPWVEGEGTQPNAASQQPPKQARITDTFPVRKGPSAAQKTSKATAADVHATRTAATERTKARAARTSAATQTGVARSRKRRNPPSTVTDSKCNDDTEAQAQTEDDDGPKTDADQQPRSSTNTTAPRRSMRNATAPQQSARGASKSASGAPASTTGTKPPGKKGPSGTATVPPRHRQRNSTAAVPRFFSSWEIDGEEFRAGDDVYVVETDDIDLLPDSDDEEDCSVCSRSNDTSRMVECDRCLRGFHFRCLKPPLKHLPEGDWYCPDCQKGVSPASIPRRIKTSCQAFLFGHQILGLARICGWVRDVSGEVQVLVRHYNKPEETHLGRLSHHHSREVFLRVMQHQEPLGCVWGRAHVVGPEQFGSTSGTDVFICEYEYDDKWKRFRRCLISEDGMTAAVSDDDEEWGAAAAGAVGRRGGSLKSTSSDEDSGSDVELEKEEDCDDDYKPRNTLDGWVVRKARPGQSLKIRTSGRKAGASGRANCYRNIIDESGSSLLLDQGATSLPERGPVGPLMAARRALALNNCTGGLPCRETEKQVLKRFIDQAVEEGGDSPGVLYICGVPGTGKTACVMEVLGGVRAAAQRSGVQLVILNALQLASPQHVYSKLWERMAGQRWGPARALKALEESFSSRAGGSSGRRHMTLLIVDEIDVLITRDQAVLYNLFEWPLRESGRLAVIGISNTHDLDSRVLPRIASRLSGSKLAFNPYNFDQLREILNCRLQGVSVIAKAAVDFCARKVASTTGDVRRALELLRRATEIAEAELATKQQRLIQQQKGMEEAPPPPPQSQDLINAVGARQAHAAIREMYGSAHMTLLRAAGLYQKLVLAALLVEMRAQSKPEVTVGALHHRLTSHLALLMKSAALPLSRVVEAAAVLGAQRLLLADAGWQGPGMRVTLNVPQDDLVALLREDPGLAAVKSCLV